MHFKCFKEFIQDLSLCFSSLHDIRVLAGIVNILEILNVEVPTIVLIDLPKSLLNQSSPEIVQFSPNSHQDLVIVQCSDPVGVESAEEFRHVFLADANFEVFACLC